MNFKPIYVWCGIPIALIMIWALAVYLPFSSQIRNREKSLDSVKQERKAVEASVVTLSRQTKSDERWKESLNAFKAQAPLIEKMPDFIREISRSARNRGVIIDNVVSVHSTIDTEKKSYVVNPVFEFDMKGGFLETGKFFEDLANRVAFKGVQKARISYDEKQYPLLAGKYTIEFKALKGKIFEGK
ncbi:MAG TPA: type 4a pilus biogenesis protein PilO [Syntrophorhabdaceae bacterium]|nr:type 4a pilus biogenesis protein PilO [Syntrophorhabdaceae bacterium]